MGVQRILCFLLLIFLLGVALGGYLTVTYIVQQGDTLYDIARKFKVSPSTILDWNSINPLRLSPGQRLLIPQPEGVMYIVKKGDTLYSIAKSFFTTVSDIKMANDLNSDSIAVGQKLFIPISCIGKAFNVEKGYIWPTYGVISSPFGWRRHPITKQMSFHSGIDIAAPEGMPVFASAPGMVIFAGEKSGYGLLVEVKGSKEIFRYAHLSKITVYVGQRVDRGTLIGRVGSTGVSTGPHLHFEIEVLAKAEVVNPLAYLPSSTKVYVLRESAEEGMGGQ
ncbi:MAG: Peptidase M23B [Thermotoga sp. 50_1627]|nr:MAG: Peptidase M23B [Thermotoga sp. 50_64]KUK25011.1 MAG: Peptidase M23B [Thermotoga sp. 50_1627]MBC7116359.1 M23 family metallopeptidase [Pseudothermotoga sp.]HBT39854.1 peptidase [Pseudothermotoga sp.]HCO98013.1 peptidase [Pseudothermotoga sp.]